MEEKDKKRLEKRIGFQSRIVGEKIRGDKKQVTWRWKRGMKKENPEVD